ncbi:hypothetical protein MLD38_013708 [Melastoma candidum]|uniref:Uncharacterized protein n=1 Tax=Melastoma candidum TaxID=119954 RepID=A0ACB9RDJ8_9MYRT|nr:hypothetical protein MLD38_013708 [Melastoma candidum]
MVALNFIGLVGFGTEYKMPFSQIHELAFVLEISQLPFFWFLRNPEQLDSSKLLPDRFLEGTSNRGMISLGRAPQVKILANPAIGGCLYHSEMGEWVRRRWAEIADYKAYVVEYVQQEHVILLENSSKP